MIKNHLVSGCWRMFIKSQALRPGSLILSASCLSADFRDAEMLKLWSKVTAFRQWKKCSMFHWLLEVTSNSWSFCILFCVPSCCHLVHRRYVNYDHFVQGEIWSKSKLHCCAASHASTKYSSQVLILNILSFTTYDQLSWRDPIEAQVWVFPDLQPCLCNTFHRCEGCLRDFLRQQLQLFFQWSCESAWLCWSSSILSQAFHVITG